jgi:hypothetical protein
MPWSRKLATPITLKDGRTIATLEEARMPVLSLPTLHRNTVMWQYTAELLKEAAADYTHVPDAEMEMQLRRSLKAEGLL